MFFKKISFYTTVVARSIKPIEVIRRGLNIISVSIEFSDSNNSLQSVLTLKDIEEIRRNQRCFLLLDFSKEGHSYKEYNIFEIAKKFANENDIEYKKIFYISSNLKDKDNDLNVVPFCYWINHCKTHLTMSSSMNDVINQIKNKKNFLSLNRRLRSFRTLTILKMLESSFFQETKLSHDRLTKEHLQLVSREFGLYIDIQDINSKSLDTDNFVQQLADIVPINLYRETLISLVGETLHDDFEGTSLFYTEKTFKPMNFLHPVLIFGQPCINTSLPEIGFKCYSKHFDLSFDQIVDPVVRLNTQLETIEKLNICLKTVDQKIEWLLSDVDTLEYNKQAIKDNLFNKQQGSKFLELIDIAIV